MDWETDKREGRRALIGHDGLPFIPGRPAACPF